MRKTFKASMTAIMLSSVALVPMATIATVATTDAAFAKSENAGGKDNGNGKSNGKSNGGQSKAQERSGGQSGSKSASSRGKGGGLGGLFDKLTGRDKATTRSANASAKPEKGSGMHPSELGNMNGALNANINAVLAHIRNGNTNGPVGHLAAIAVAADGAIGAQDLLDQELEFKNLDKLLAAGGENYSSLEEYYDYRNGIDAIDAIDDAAAAIAVLDLADTDPTDLAYVEAEANLATALASSPYSDLATYENDVDGYGSVLEVDNAIEALGGEPIEELDFTDERPDEFDVAGATDALDAQGDAEADILAYWNKNPGVPEIVVEGEPTPQEVLLDKLYERLEGNEEAIADAIGEPEMDEEIGEGATDCEGAEGCVDDEDTAELIE